MQQISTKVTKKKSSYLSFGLLTLLTIGLMSLAACGDTSPVLGVAAASTATPVPTTAAPTQTSTPAATSTGVPATATATRAPATPTPARPTATATPDPDETPTSQIELKEYVSEKGKYSILLPGAVETTDQSLISKTEGQIGSIESVVTADRENGVIFWVSYVDYDADYVKEHGAAALYKAQRKDIEKIEGVTFKSEKDVKLAGKYPGKEFFYTASGFGPIGQRYYLVGNRMYSVAVAGIFGYFPKYTLQVLDSLKATS